MSVNAAVALSRLAEIAGESNVIGDPAQLARYAIDGKPPSAGVRPGTSEEVAEIVKLAARGGLAMVASGARTKLGMGMPPRQYDLALDMSRMDGIVAYDPGDLTLSVEAGAPLRKIAAALGEHRQFLPLAVPFADRATAGGTVASGVDSPLRQSYGTARDFVLGVEFVTGQGIAAKSGGRVVKNVSGYDIHKLMIGSLGTLGAITRINFRTFPLPRMTATFVAAFRGPQGACRLRHAVAQSLLRPRSFDLIAATGAEGSQLGRRAGLNIASGRWIVLASFAGDEHVLERNRREFESLARQASDASLESFEDLGQGSDAAMRLASEFPAYVLEEWRSAAILKVGALPTELLALANACQSIALPWALLMRGLGLAYLALLAPDESEGSQRARKKECARILSLAGEPPWRHVTLPWCPAALKREVHVWGAPAAAEPELGLAKKLKAVFDPAGILSPGRFMGGI